ncbi:MAG TPA: YfhO family protein [Thermoanaerobaculia bacterium]
MPAVVLYLIVAVALLFVWNRFVQPLTRGAALALLLLPLVFTARALVTGGVYAPIDLPYMSEPLKDYARDYGISGVHNGTLSDLYAQIIPWQSAVRRSFAHGQWPVWNPYLLCGNILAANMQAAPYDPLQLLGMLLPHAQALTFMAAMTFFLAALFTFGFARAIGCGETPALIAAAGYSFCAMLAFFVGWPLGRAWAFLPLVLLGVRLIAAPRVLGSSAPRVADGPEEPRSRGARGAVVLTSAFVATIFAGHPESVLHIVAAGAAYGAFEVLRTRRWKAIAQAALCGVIALLLTAISLVPFFSAAPQTVEYDLRHDVYATTNFFTTFENVGKRAAATFFPWFGGQPERDNFTDEWQPTAARTGALIVALSLAALVLAPRRGETWFFFGAGVIALLASIDAWPVAHLLHELPLFNIALNERLAFAAAFALSILAGIAADALPSTRGRALAAAAVIAAVGIALAVIGNAITPRELRVGVRQELITTLKLAELIPVAIAALLVATRTRYALPLLLALLLIQRHVEDGRIYPTFPQKAFYPVTPLLQQILKDGDTPFRIAGMYYSFVPDTAALYGLEDARGYEAMTYRRLTDTFPLWCQAQPVSFNTIIDMNRPFLSFLNIRYMLAGSDVPPGEGWQLVMEDRGTRLYRNTRVLPRAFVPRRVRYERSSTDVLRGMFDTKDFGETAFITVRHYPPHEIANGPGALTLRRDGFDYEIDATMELDGWVVVSESAWSGWRAYVDEHRVETQSANHAFLGVFVPKGKHHVRLIYRPEPFTRGRNISLATLAALILWLALRHRIQKPRAVGV